MHKVPSHAVEYANAASTAVCRIKGSGVEGEGCVCFWYTEYITLKRVFNLRSKKAVICFHIWLPTGFFVRFRDHGYGRYVRWLGWIG